MVSAVQPSANATGLRPAANLSFARGGLSPGNFALLLGALIFAAFPQVVLGLETFVVRDYGFFSYPVAQFQRDCFWRGELPLWNPYNNCGLPFLAQWNTMPLYPPALLYLLFPLTWSLSFFCLAHLFWAGLGMYRLAWRWTGSQMGAAVAGLVFAFNGFSLNLLMWPSHIATFSWMPWVVLLVECGWAHGGRNLVVAVIAGTLQMLAGGPETILFTWVISAAIWGTQIVRHFFSHPQNGPELTSDTGKPKRSSLYAFLSFPVIVLLVAGLSAAQLAPFLDLASHSQRGTGFADTRWSMPKTGWANFLVPLAFGTTFKQQLFFQHGQMWTSSYYLGVGALLLAGLGLWRARHKRVWFLMAVALLGIVFAGGDQNPVSREVRHWLPQLSLMTYPVKYVAFTIFAVPLLSAFGIQGWLNEEQGRRTTRWRLFTVAVLLLVLIAGIIFWARSSPLPNEDPAATTFNGLSRAGFVMLVTLLLLAWPKVFNKARRIMPWALCLLFWLDVWTHQPPQNPSVPAGIYQKDLARQYLEMKPQPTLGGPRVMLTPQADAKFMSMALASPKENFLAKRLGYFADCNLLDGIPKVNGFFSLYPRECGELNSVLYVSGQPCSSGLADFMSVSHVTATGEYMKWERRSSFLPLATAGQRPVFVDDTNALFGILASNFAPAKLVALPLEAKSVVSVTNSTQAEVRIQQFAPTHIELDVNAADSALVVLAQTYYHQWHVAIDGHPNRLLRANYAFQAVEVPPGKHLVAFSYQDRALFLGLAISAASLIICVVLWQLSGPPNFKSEFTLRKSGAVPP